MNIVITTYRHIYGFIQYLECVKHQILNTEKTVPIVYQPQAVFKVRPVSRCTSSMPGHTKEVLVASFSTSGRFLGTWSFINITISINIHTAMDK